MTRKTITREAAIEAVATECYLLWCHCTLNGGIFWKVYGVHYKLTNFLLHLTDKADSRREIAACMIAQYFPETFDVEIS